ncbi:MAG: aspartyl protease family protein [Flavobacteriaceae bacterium]
MREYLALFLLLLFWLPFKAGAQHYHLPDGEKYEKIKFQLVNNLIIVPIEVNGIELSFILDSGVRRPILFNLSERDSISLNNVSEISIQGLGNGEPIKALVSKGNIFKIKDVVNESQQLYVVLDKEMNFSPRLGMPIHGIIGYDLFRDFVVDINYHAQSLKLHDPRYYKNKVTKRDQRLPISIIGNKSYVDGSVVMEDEREVPVKLLVDTGSGDALWLFRDLEKGLGVPEKNFHDYLGKGLNGHIFGRRTKITGIKIGRFELNDVKAAFPDMESYAAIVNLGNRNGSVGGEVLKRFDIVFNYSMNEIIMRKNGHFGEPFHYNMSGIDVQHNGVRYIAEKIKEARPATVGTTAYDFGNVQLIKEDVTRLSLVPEIVVSGIRAGSPADEAGLKEGDIIIAINGKKIHRYKLQEVVKLLNEKEGKRIQVLIERYNRDLLFSFVLENVLK